MNFKIIVIIAIAYLYGFFEYYLSIRQKNKIKIVHKGDLNSLMLLYASITIGYIFSFAAATSKIGRIYHWDIFFVIGIVIIIAGFCIRIISIRVLNKYFTYTVTQTENHELIEKGFYKYIRHPGYLGQLIIFIGISTSLSNWLSIILMFVSTLTGYLYRIRVEENFMLEQMGTKYAEYQKRTKMFIPKIF